MRVTAQNKTSFLRRENEEIRNRRMWDKRKRRDHHKEKIADKMGSEFKSSLKPVPSVKIS